MKITKDTDMDTDANMDTNMDTVTGMDMGMVTDMTTDIFSFVSLHFDSFRFSPRFLFLSLLNLLFHFKAK
jgi:hypothetical protein